MKKIWLILLCLIGIRSYGTHIIGGEIIYDKLSGDDYRITLKVYRDCLNGQAAFDGLPNANAGVTPAILTVYTAGNVLYGTYNLGTPVVTQIPPSINNPCIQPPQGICVEEGIYTMTLSLPAQVGEFTLIYQRCCRNHSILNLVTPGSQGATYYTKIPSPEVIAFNNSPRFKTFPPIYICNNLNFTFDHSATDPDGDQLYYSLCAPFQGLDPTCPSISPGGCATEALPPPFPNVMYTGAYTGADPISANPAFSIHPTTGLLTGKPNLLGQFVVGICVQEFRNGILINTHYRDFQFNVVSCIVSVTSLFADQIYKCEGSAISFTNQSQSNIGSLTFLWDFGVPNLLSDTSNLFNPTYTYQDTGRYEVTLIANPNKPCSDTVKKTVHVYPPLEIEFPPNANQCLKNNSFNFYAQGVHMPQATFNWDFSASATPSTSTQKNPSAITYSQAGVYYVKLIAKQLTCIDSFIDTIRVLPRVVAEIKNLPLSQCDPAKIGFSNGSSAGFPITYQWQFSNGNTSPEFQPVQVFSPPGIYGATLTAITHDFCPDTSVAAVHNITVNPTPTAGFKFTPTLTTIFDPEIYFESTASFDVIQWYYTFGNGKSSQFPIEKCFYDDYGDYLVTQYVINQYGCRDSITDVVKILPEFRFWIPNTFTPDGNNRNDEFKPVVIGVTNYEFDIFDRWGEKIFSTIETKQGWNGFYKGKECQQDVYVWRVSFKNVVTTKDEIHYGHVLLLKNL
jgi:gliding motility-associated-like protein